MASLGGCRNQNLAGPSWVTGPAELNEMLQYHRLAMASLLPVVRQWHVLVVEKYPK
jgi:hypothetical protein